MSKKNIIFITCIVLGIVSVIGIRIMGGFQTVDKSGGRSELAINEKASSLPKENSTEDEVNDLRNGKDKNNSLTESSKTDKGIEREASSNYDLSDNSGQDNKTETVYIEEDNKNGKEHEEKTKSQKIERETEPEQDWEAEERKAKLETTNPLLYAEYVTTTSDEEKILVGLIIKNNPGLLGMVVSIYFDEEALRLSKVKNGDAVDDVLSLTASKDLKSGCKFVWDGQSLDKKDIQDGTLMEMEFQFVSEVLKGKYPITIICESGDAVDSNLQPINFEILDGLIKVK